MPAVSYNITVEEGATFGLSARFGTLLVDGMGVPILDGDGKQQIDVGRDFTGCTFRMQIRKGKKPTAEVMATVTSEDINGGIAADNDGNVDVVISDESADGVTKDGWYDLKCYNVDGTEDRLLEGTVTVDRAVTEDE